MKIFNLACFFLLLCIPVSLYSQNNVAVKGVILDSETQETIPYATIRIYQEPELDEVHKVVPTDEDGNFKFDLNQKGNYSLFVEFIGKARTEQKFTIGDSKTVDLGKILMKDDSKLLGEVVVSAQRPLIKAELDKIVYNIEDDPESKTNNALDMLKKVPMITVDGDDNIQLKGSSGYKIYLNGKPSSMIASNRKDVLKSMPASSIKNIEVITDPGAKYDAEGLAGIINITTQSNSSMGGYNARINSRVDSRGNYGFGGFLTAKKGKLGFTGNLNYYSYQNPNNGSTSYVENVADSDYKYLFQNERGDYDGNGIYGSGEISYEIDTLNLINVGFNLYSGKNNGDYYTETMYKNTLYEITQQYEQRTKGVNKYGESSINADYQRISSKNKDRIFTTSYRLNLNPYNGSSDNSRVGILATQDMLNNQYTDASSNEHTFQVDYTTPIGKIHTVEAGAKYILRLNESHSGYEYRNSILEEWTPQPNDQDKFKHHQNILSAYLSYNVKFKKIGFKTGVRYEYTDVQVKYALNTGMNFGTDYSNLVPSATITYQLNPSQTFRLGYNMRIQRPGIWELNPYANTTDSTNIRTGNPELDAVKSHNISLNYGYFNSKLNINSNLFYEFSNNSIDQIMTFDDGIRKTTYENIGKNKKLGLSMYINWSPTQKIRFTSNLTGLYLDTKTNNGDQLSNSSFGGNAYANLSYQLPQKIRANAMWGGGIPPSSLQITRGGYSYYGLTLSKDFLKNESLNVSLSAYNIFTKNGKYHSETVSPTVYMRTDGYYPKSRISLSVSFKFGEMKEQVKKVSRSINNDDSMGGGGGTPASGGGQ